VQQLQALGQTVWAICCGAMSIGTPAEGGVVMLPQPAVPSVDKRDKSGRKKVARPPAGRSARLRKTRPRALSFIARMFRLPV
jgi:hypothetical protein